MKRRLSHIGFGKSLMPASEDQVCRYPKYKRDDIVNKKNPIPKTIHWCYISESYPPLVEKCLQTWQKYCPEYTIKRWDLTNINFEDLPKWCKVAYDNKLFAFVADYIRVKALYEEGGVYLDSDVCICRPKPFEMFQYDRLWIPMENVANISRCFWLGYGFKRYVGVNPVFFGAIKGHPFLKDLLEFYNTFPDDYAKQACINDGCSAPIAPAVFSKVMENYGLRYLNKEQYLDEGIHVVTNEHFDHDPPPERRINMYAIHLCTHSWIKKNDEDSNTQLIYRRERIPKILHRVWLSYDGKSYNETLNERCQNAIKMQNECCKDFTIMEWGNECVDYYLEKYPMFKRYYCDVKNLAFCSDIIRLDVLYRFGGIYLDTDVEVFQSLNDDNILRSRFFIGQECTENYRPYAFAGHMVSNGIMGAEKGSRIIKSLLDVVTTPTSQMHCLQDEPMPRITMFCRNHNHRIIETFKELQDIDVDECIPIFKAYNLDRANDHRNTCDLKLFDHFFNFSWRKFTNIYDLL